MRGQLCIKATAARYTVNPAKGAVGRRILVGTAEKRSGHHDSMNVAFLLTVSGKAAQTCVMMPVRCVLERHRSHPEKSMKTRLDRWPG